MNLFDSNERLRIFSADPAKESGWAQHVGEELVASGTAGKKGVNGAKGHFYLWWDAREVMEQCWPFDLFVIEGQFLDLRKPKAAIEVAKAAQVWISHFFDLWSLGYLPPRGVALKKGVNGRVPFPGKLFGKRGLADPVEKLVVMQPKTVYTYLNLPRGVTVKREMAKKAILDYVKRNIKAEVESEDEADAIMLGHVAARPTKE